MKYYYRTTTQEQWRSPAHALTQRSFSHSRAPSRNNRLPGGPRGSLMDGNRRQSLTGAQVRTLSRAVSSAGPDCRGSAHSLTAPRCLQHGHHVRPRAWPSLPIYGDGPDVSPGLGLSLAERPVCQPGSYPSAVRSRRGRRAGWAVRPRGRDRGTKEDKKKVIKSCQLRCRQLRSSWGVWLPQSFPTKAGILGMVTDVTCMVSIFSAEKNNFSQLDFLSFEQPKHWILKLAQVLTPARWLWESKCVDKRFRPARNAYCPSHYHSCEILRILSVKHARP